MASREPSSTREILTPTQLNARSRQLLESGMGSIWLEGEISNLSTPASGHRYFTLKDARAQVRCALFKNRSITTALTYGQQIVVRAQVTLYEARGDYQLIVEAVEDAGEGRLRLAYEQLKKKLAAEGLFDAPRPPLPRFPRHLAVISSPSGAALRDVLSVLGRRYPVVRVTVVPSPVQGSEAPAALRAALVAAERLQPDAILLTRGGGSLEDLWAFNDEALARRIHACSIPVVSAIGHEVDFSISDFVATARAATPSAAAELLVPDRHELLATLLAAQTRLEQTIRRRLDQVNQRLDHHQARLRQASPGRRLLRGQQQLVGLRQRLLRNQQLACNRQAERLQAARHRLRRCSPAAQLTALAGQLRQLNGRRQQAVRRQLELAGAALATAARALQSVNPLAVLQRGYSITRVEDGELLRHATDAAVGQTLSTRLARGTVRSRVTAITPEDD